MQFTLPFGHSTHWILDITGPKISRLGPTVRSGPLHDPASSVREALTTPLDYPPLASTTVPGDQVVVTIPGGLPALEPLAWGILRALLDTGVEPAHLVFLVADGITETALATCRQSLVQDHSWLHEVRIVRHDPNNTDSCSLINVTRSGRPLRMNRLVCEADLVLPVGVVTTAVDTCAEKPPPLTGLFPDFADNETLGHFYAPSSRENRVHRSRRGREIEEASLLLAGGAVIQIVPASGDQVTTLFAGHPLSVAAAAWEACLDTWTPTIPTHGDLAIGLLTGSATTQSWSSIGQGLLAAEAVLDHGGTVVLCTDLEQSPGPSLGRLCQQDDRTGRQHEIMRDREVDSWTALQLSRALQRGSVYLHSRLKESVVESLGMTPIASSEELSRLVASHAHAIILDDVQWLAPRVR